MSGKIIVTRKDNKIISALFDGEELVSINASHSCDEDILGNIYLGKVSNIVKNINAAFVEIEGKRVCYLPLTEKERPVFANPRDDGRLRVGDEIIVQVAKEDKSAKAPVLTAAFSLTGKYVVLVHGKQMLGVSSKIADEQKRQELKELIKPHIGEDYGFIVRTNAVNAYDELILKEVLKLKSDYESLLRFGVHWKAFSRLYTSTPQYLWDIRDAFDADIAEIKTDDEEIFREIKEFLSEINDEELKKINLYTDKTLSLDALYGISNKIEKALQKNVWLNSGGYLVIEPTEALVSIDVNTGKAIASKTDPEETFFRINKEAAVEIAKQLRIRNYSGIIIIDFIDMKSEENRKEVINLLRKEISKDRIYTSFVDMTSLGLVELTRKKIRKPLHEQLA